MSAFIYFHTPNSAINRRLEIPPDNNFWGGKKLCPLSFSCPFLTGCYTSTFHRAALFPSISVIAERRHSRGESVLQSELGLHSSHLRDPQHPSPKIACFFPQDLGGPCLPGRPCGFVSLPGLPAQLPVQLLCFAEQQRLLLARAEPVLRIFFLLQHLGA